MSLARSVFRNAVFKGAGEVVVRLLSFAFVVFVARSLQASDFGVLNFAYSFPILFIVLADFGFNPLLIREASRQPEQAGKIFFNLFGMKSLLSLAYAGAVALGLRLLSPAAPFYRVAYLLALFMLLNSFTEFLNAVFQSRQRMELEALVMSWQKLSLLVLGLLALALGWGLEGVAAAYVAAGACGLVAAALLLRQTGFVRGAWRFDPAYLRYALGQALPLTLTTLFINIYFRIDMTLLAKMRPAAEVGWYGAAHKCIEVLMVVPAVLVAASFPGFSRLFVENPERLRQASHNLLRLLLLLAVPLAAGGILLGRPLLELVFGAGYRAAGGAFGWLAVALAFIFMNYLLSYLLISGGRQKINALVAGLAVIVSVGANLLLIPRFGYLGAAASAAATEAVLFAAYFGSVHRLLFPLSLGKPLLRVLLATAVMLIPVWWLRQTPVPAVILGLAAYLAAAWWLKALHPDDLEIWKRIFRRSDHA